MANWTIYKKGNIHPSPVSEWRLSSQMLLVTTEQLSLDYNENEAFFPFILSFFQSAPSEVFPLKLLDLFTDKWLGF